MMARCNTVPTELIFVDAREKRVNLETDIRFRLISLTCDYAPMCVNYFDVTRL
jgi:hypothetical protein